MGINMKNCTRCNIEKEICNYHKCAKSPDKLAYYCKSCTSIVGKLYQIKNKDKSTKKTQDWRTNNPDKYKKSCEDYYINNKDRLSKLNKNWKIKHRSKATAIEAKRRATKIQATPNWLTKEQIQQIEEFYEIAQAFKLYTGQEYHVDHIVPLQGENVCGLHVPWNLQVISAKENLSKSNKFDEKFLEHVLQ
jgi:hypothetical protein